MIDVHNKPEGVKDVLIESKNGSHLSNSDARRVYEVLKHIPEEEHSASRLLEEARDPKSLIHHIFEWNDTKAAEEFRKGQARKAMNAVNVRIVYFNREEIRPAFYAVSTDVSVEKSYVSFEHASKDERARKEILERAYMDFQAFQKRLSRHRKIFAEEKLDIVLSMIDRPADEVFGKESLKKSA